MEPMAVSPGKSPVSSNQYLPSFLMGELASPTPGLQASSPLPATSYSRSSRSKLEGPPIVGLFDEINSSPTVSPSNTMPLSQHNNTSFLTDTSYLENQENRNFWVVVYGFPPSQVNQIIAMFSQLGRVAEHNYPVNANWVYICYTNQADMRKALSMNSKVLSGNVMIGVTERKQQLFQDKENQVCYHNLCRIHDFELTPSSNSQLKSLPSFTSLSPIPCHQVGNEGGGFGVSTPTTTSQANISITSPTSPKIRPLAISKRLNAQSPVSNGPVPTADTSIVGKIMDLVFSW